MNPKPFSRTINLALVSVVLFSGGVARAQWTGITGPSCGMNNAAFNPPAQIVPTCTWAKSEYKNSITFYANATCSSPCERNPIRANYSLNIGQNNGPCNTPVTYSFVGTSGDMVDATGQNEFLGVSVYLTATSGPGGTAWAEQVSDCNGNPYIYNLPAWTQWVGLGC